jgi:hypothetical protein
MYICIYIYIYIHIYIYNHIYDRQVDVLAGNISQVSHDTYDLEKQLGLKNKWEEANQGIYVYVYMYIYIYVYIYIYIYIYMCVYIYIYIGRAERGQAYMYIYVYIYIYIYIYIGRAERGQASVSFFMEKKNIQRSMQGVESDPTVYSEDKTTEGLIDMLGNIHFYIHI